MATTVFHPLDDFTASGWSAFAGGFYVHRNIVWLQGVLEPAPWASEMILTGLPSGIRPSADVAVTVAVNLQLTTDPATPGIPVIGSTVSATITAGGDLVLDSLPAFMNSVPNGSLTNVDTGDDFTSVLHYAFELGSVNWAIGDPEDDVYSGDSLAPYLDGDFEDIDATIALHGTRVHLGGHIRATRNGASNISASIPSVYTDAVAATDDGRADTIARTPAFAPVLHLDPSESSLRAFGDNRPPRDAPLDWVSGANGVGGDGRPVVDSNFAVGDLGNQESRVAGLVTHPGGSGLLLPSPGYQRAQIVGNDDYISGVIQLGRAGHITWDHGTYSCGGTPCKANGASGAPLVLSVSDQTDDFHPEPDWIAVFVLVEEALPTLDYRVGCSGSACGPWAGATPPLVIETDISSQFITSSLWEGLPDFMDLSAAFPSPMSVPAINGLADSSGVLSPGRLAWSITGSLLPGGETAAFRGYVQRPSEAMEYPHDPYNLASSLLWRPGEIDTVTFTVSGDTNSGDLACRVVAVPFWESRRNWILAGDVLDLTDAGWEGVPPPPLPPAVETGNVRAGGWDSGIVPLGGTARSSRSVQ